MANIECSRDNIKDACQFCILGSMDCVGPGNTRRGAIYEGVDQSLDGQKSVHGEYEIGQAVMVRQSSGGWEEMPRMVKRIIYQPVAVILDDEDSPSLPIDCIRPFPTVGFQVADGISPKQANGAAQTAHSTNENVKAAP